MGSRGVPEDLRAILDGPARRWIEALLRARHVQEKIRRSEARRKALIQRFHLAHDLCSSDGVDVSEGAAAEWREADAEHRADVAVPGRSQNSLLETAHGFVDHREHAAIHDLVLLDAYDWPHG